MRHAALVRANTIHPGAEHLWTFTPPPHIPHDAPTWMQFHCDSSAFGGSETAIYCYPGSLVAAIARSLDVSPIWQPTPIVTGIPARLPTPTHLDSFINPNSGIHSLTIQNADPAQATLFFDPDDGVVLRVRTGSFAGNYLRAGLLLYGRLALLAAVGLALGTFFSTPVAAFASVVLVLLLQLSGFIGGAAQADRAVFVANVAPFGAHVHGHDAEAEAAKVETEARGQAAAIFAKYEAEAKGNFEVLKAKGDGYRMIIESCGKDADAAAKMLLVEKLEEIVKLQTEAISNIKIDKVTVWDSPNGHADGKSSTAGFLSGMMQSLPPIHDVAAMAGIELPKYLGEMKDKTVKDEPEAAPAAE